jgi:hypothetical protein
MRRITVEERRARLGLRHALAAPADTPVEAAAAVVALHGTDAASVFLAAMARMRDGDVAAVEHALYEERSLLRVLSMRRTMFVAPVETAAVMLAACSRDVAARERRKLIGFLEAAGVGGAEWLAGAEQAALEALAARGEATATELASDDPRLATQLVLGAGSKYEAKVSVASRVLIVLGAEGRVIRTRPSGSWTSTQFRWAALTTWHPGVTDHADDVARVELARLYLRAFGHGGGPALVGRLDGRSDPRRAGGRGHGRDRRRAAPGRRRGLSRGGAVGGAASRARSHDDGLEGARVVPRRPPRAPVRPQRQRVPDRVVGGTDRRRLGAGARRGDPHAPAGGRRGRGRGGD